MHRFDVCICFAILSNFLCSFDLILSDPVSFLGVLFTSSSPNHRRLSQLAQKGLYRGTRMRVSRFSAKKDLTSSWTLAFCIHASSHIWHQLVKTKPFSFFCSLFLSLSLLSKYNSSTSPCFISLLSGRRIDHWVIRRKRSEYYAHDDEVKRWELNNRYAKYFALDCDESILGNYTN